MTAPGLAMFYGGLVRKKNVLSVMMQCVFLMGLMTVIWGLYGYSLAFGDDRTRQAVYRQRRLSVHERRRPQLAGRTRLRRSSRFWPGVIPRLTHMLFQGMFFIITPALICGAFAERMKFSTMVVFMILWGTLVYCPLCHWVWDGGMLAYVPVAGVTPLAGRCARLRRRHGRAHQLGRLGPDLCPGDRQAPGLRQRRHAAAQPDLHGARRRHAVGRLVRLQRRQRAGVRRPGRQRVLHDALRGRRRRTGLGRLRMDHARQAERAGRRVGRRRRAGVHYAGRRLCATDAGAGHGRRSPASSAPSPAASSRHAFGYDDSLDAFGVHGVGGTLGAILTGVFATRAAWDIGALNGSSGTSSACSKAARVLMGQLVAVVVTWVFSIVATFIILKVLDAIVGLRVTQQEEMHGLDLTQHGEEGYIFV